MNDDALITVLREQRGKVPMTIPVQQIISRGRVVRTRRRVPGVAAAAVGAAAAAGVAVSVALPASHPATASHPASGPAVKLAAWTVARQADGSIKVTFRQATDAAGLQRTLRADGVPASVRFTGQQNLACRAGIPGRLANKVGGSRIFYNPQNPYETQDALVIHPSALPAGLGLQIWTSGTPGAAGNFQLHVGLVQASPGCTGS